MRTRKWSVTCLNGSLILVLVSILPSTVKGSSSCLLIIFSDFLRHECQLFLQTSGIHLTVSLMKLYSCLMEEIKNSGADGSTGMSQMQISLWLQCLMLFSVVWAIGGTMTGDSRKKFDVFFRNLIAGTDQEFPRPKSFKLGKVLLYKLRIFSVINYCTKTYFLVG